MPCQMLVSNRSGNDYGEPTIKALTSLVGMAVLIALLVKHIIDIKTSLNSKDD